MSPIRHEHPLPFPALAEAVDRHAYVLNWSQDQDGVRVTCVPRVQREPLHRMSYRRQREVLLDKANDLLEAVEATAGWRYKDAPTIRFGGDVRWRPATIDLPGGWVTVIEVEVEIWLRPSDS